LVTANALLLDGFVELKSKDWIVLNPANSQAARRIIAIAKWRGLKVVAIVRQSKRIAEVEDLGVDFVGVEL
jgi:NADPH2:quinone reductase